MRAFFIGTMALVGCSGPTTEPTPVPTTPETGLVSNLAWSLHPEMESLVQVTWSQARAAEAVVQVRFDPGTWVSAPAVQGVAGDNEQLVVGIPFSSEADLRVVVGEETFVAADRIVTGDLPPVFPTPRVLSADPTGWLAHGHYLLTSVNQEAGGWRSGGHWTVILDRQARPVWARRAPARHWTLYPQVSVSGDHLLWDEATYWSDFDDGEGSLVHRTYLDAEIDVMPTPGLHHAFVELPDGTLAWGSKFHGGSEALVELAPGATDVSVIWSCTDAEVAFCESNCLYYHEPDDTYLFSFYTNDTVIEVDRSTGDTLWWAGELENGFEFSPPSSQFVWQHGVTYTDSGTLLLSSEAQRQDGKGRETWLREYAVDRDAGVLQEVWNAQSGTYAVTNGDAWRLPNGNTLHSLGSAGQIKEVDANGRVVWHLTMDGTFMVGRAQFIEDLYTLVAP
ncbi:MAG: arylsulfotransferase family protein [Myxococcales bacterium]|nr:arylsulfotransferase family protein [Myxococcales bacterium]